MFQKGMRKAKRQAELPVCPHLGSATEPLSHGGGPTPEHRCYLWMQGDRVDLAHQKNYCLSSEHASCPWLAMKPPATGKVAQEKSPSLAMRPTFSSFLRKVTQAELPS